MKKTAIALILVVVLLCAMVQPVAAARPTHGTSDKWITEDMLTEHVPPDYMINEATQAEAEEGRYNAYFRKDDLQTVSITVDEDNLNYLLQNAVDEPYVLAKSVTIGDTTVGYCGLRTKGNFTLDHSYADNPGSDRFSFTVNFGEYVKKQTHGQKQNFFGCDRISFNNFFFDKSMLKEFFSLMLMEQMGLPTPQFGLAKLYINDRYYGVFFMVEAMDESILEQYFRVDDSQLSSYLCKPTATRLRYDELSRDPAPLYEHSEETKAEVADMLPTVMEWVRKLNCLAAGTDFSGNKVDVQSQAYLDLLAQVMDVEETVRYFAVHSWLCQMDNMFVGFQNFGLYISPEGISTLIPWDYDLAFGCYYPSTAENTANYPLDVMYRLDPALWAEESEHSDRFYKTFPLFYAIYQNASLMQRYREYMLDCSRIAALGGYVACVQKQYDSAWFQSFLEKLEEPLLAAAAEPLADNVYYMNYIRQPQDVKAALPHLTRIIALRSVGVYNQITGEDAWVCGSGCNLETLGNAIHADSARQGRLTLVDPYTGVFATAQFNAGNRSQTPVLTVDVLAGEDAAYQTAAEKAEAGLGDQLLVYRIRSSVKPSGSYKLTIPLSAEAVKDSASYTVFRIVGEELVRLDARQNGNLLTCDLEELGAVAILVDLPVFSMDNPHTYPLILAACGIAAAGVVAFTVAICCRYRKKRSF